MWNVVILSTEASKRALRGG